MDAIKYIHDNGGDLNARTEYGTTVLEAATLNDQNDAADCIRALGRGSLRESAGLFSRGVTSLSLKV